MRAQNLKAQEVCQAIICQSQPEEVPSSTNEQPTAETPATITEPDDSAQNIISDSENCENNSKLINKFANLNELNNSQ